MIRKGIVAWALVVMAAALWTGAAAPGGPRFFTSMTGLLPPHYGYSAYAISTLLFLAPWPWARWAGGAALLLSGNRASWVGVIGGWASLGGARRALLAGFLALGATIGGYAWKYTTNNDSARILIWRAVWRESVKHPEGIGRGKFIAAVEGYAVTKAHSDVMQLLVEGGVALTAYVLAALILGLAMLPPGPGKAAVVALTVQSVIDNRLHHPACAFLYAAVWLAALRGEPAPSRPEAGR